MTRYPRARMNDATCATTMTTTIVIGIHWTICQTDPAPNIQAATSKIVHSPATRHRSHRVKQ